MIFYTITDTLPVVPDWSSITGDLKAGTPISIKGAVANDEAAIGLVAGDTAHGAEYAVVVTAGVVDLNAASASYGSTVSDDVVQALDNVTFIYGGKVYAVSGSSLPDYSEASDGDVLSISSGVPGWVTPSGGGVFAFKVTLLDLASGAASCNKTANEILTAYKAGMTMVCTISNDNLFDAAPALAAITTNSAGTALTSVYALSADLSLGDPILGDPPALSVFEAIYESGTWTVNYRDIFSAS